MAKKSRKIGRWHFLFAVLVLGWFSSDDESDSRTTTTPEVVVSTQQRSLPDTKFSVAADQSQPSTKVASLDVPSETKIFIENLKPDLPVQLPKTKKAIKLEPKVPTRQTLQLTPTRTLYVDASRLNVRNGPSKTNKVIWTLKRDQEVQVVRTQGDWSFLKGARFEGWVFKTYLTPKKSAPVKVAKRSPPQKKIVKRNGKSTAAIKKLLIKRSHAYYPGSCPCPYYRDRAGRKCGRRSAYSRPGGRSPLCYSRDVSAQMVADYRARQ